MREADKLNEQSTGVITASFFDENGGAITPTAGTYTIHDKATGTEILASTPLPAPLAESIDITVTHEQNEIINAANEFDVHILTTKFQYGPGGAKQGTDKYEFKVINLRYIS